MKKILLETKFSKLYMIIVIILTLLVVGGYYSYAMFTVNKEKSNAISIVTGTLSYDLSIDGAIGNTLSVNSGETKEFTVTLSNPNNRIARFNFYYIGALPDGVSAGYVTGDGLSTPPLAAGVNLEADGSVGASNVYKIRVTNNSGNNATITLGVQVGLDYNDLALPSNGHLFEEAKIEGPVADVIKMNIGENGAINTSDPDQTFITGTDPNNYIWYSGKLWRAVSIDPSDNSVKLITQWNISTVSFNEENNTAFVGSHMEEWLNDTSADGFLGNLREPEKFIKMDSVWNATVMTDTTKPAETTMVTDPVGLLNIYEYTMSYSGTTYNSGYLNNELYWWTITPYDVSSIWFIYTYGIASDDKFSYNNFGVRPTINLKSNIKIVDGEGTVDKPYRLSGDNDTDLSGTLLNTRYSGEYIRFGVGENNLYRIVSHENGIGTKVTSAEPLKSGETFVTSAFDNNGNINYSSTNIIGTFLNNDYLNTESSYLTIDDIAMIEDETKWYLGKVDYIDNYKLAKYHDIDMISMAPSTSAKIGLLRLGELMSGQFNIYDNNIEYYLVTPYKNEYHLWYIYPEAVGGHAVSNTVIGVRPALNLKSNVIITGGDGTLQNPFTLALA